MKKLLVFGVICIGISLSACNSLPSLHKKQRIGMANPASEYCVEQQGKLKQLKDAYGNVSFNCKLPNGVEKNEWDLYRENHR
ncbi:MULTISPECIES: putative hemolysin [Acinetobacter]|uniref:DUF333 domain-containing protein n=1 Tax=Acinetobacter pollinis TaxID=2605270 RepID=A0ABU6DVL1_9GAMM|nr:MULTISPECIES: DUF333 domain-containing protein [Acinetobacter]MBF7691499.1 DUF333 domain-containing protein [Acinetobacter pollinis]MBF7693335.1 DUF333 domain-containing protein [Acinetobacter pollinis]MBF7699181.1 DUF333 domain-containing protein [Acinetobacter pollinis]MBF7701536.1 DUF333 domain-containing protein [Acinetobacter pollinis]MEB5477169.1 DUF333 domain-containing protein [Acinetobacter pollinis]